MSKEERFIYHCDNYDYIETIYDAKEYEECDSMQMATNWLNRQYYKNKILEKALELACEQIWAMSIWENAKEEIIQDNIKFFKDKAKEMRNE